MQRPYYYEIRSTLALSLSSFRPSILLAVDGINTPSLGLRCKSEEEGSLGVQSV